MHHYRPSRVKPGLVSLVCRPPALTFWLEVDKDHANLRLESLRALEEPWVIS